MLFAVASVLASFERLRRVHRVAAFDLDALARALGTAVGASRLRQMADLMHGERPSWEGELILSVLQSRNPAERTASVNEYLGDVASALRWGSHIPVTAARLSAAGPLCVLFFALARGAIAAAEIVPVIAWGGAGVVGALATGREANRVAAEIRKAVDRWVARVLEAASVRDSPS
ncbi:MAG TPA: hypothetical protein VF881_16250 [Polyangiaceae bacterium]